MKGYLQVYTGEGKGKTTAALGLALRAAGAGMKVFLAQFAKGEESSELRSLERLSDLITVRRYGRGRFIRGKPAEEDARAARKGLEEVRQVLASGEFQVVILDEANIATHFHLFSVRDLLEVIEARPPEVEMVITGRRAAPEVLEKADLVTDMRNVKHYYDQGVQARKGIEE